ncbi:uncharacterized protein L3040_006684 [Drepanopeziza brunnea f. sp. 'multigermtubi']|uniref:Uncharacterized protein n=1 Tax=Marssonina brunnea f. sp. multigermtubi (strain MB_m1) TaxID=1072389 RepID=K1WIU6_MARBU|nr:uncharacterized protein MBM_04426 [Drepanopeziza brunnea f. sp. 'multigermtubi' MB_m1]EKD17565.1 hypothetical protein MBM_04426 [Drepanopeziza brunnea f. sp. 'multigermtubi' MB_m1]KAJ5039012.1 hypothetical protein L3040_006684 [Drepanopeziza brunnea f. sp. 'multigermtubi']
MSSSSPAGMTNPAVWKLKEMLIEWRLTELTPEDVMALNSADLDFSELAVFDPNELEGVESGAPLYTGHDLYAAPRVGGSELLKDGVFAILKANKALVPKVRELLDKELLQSGYGKDYLGKRTNTMQKATALAIHRCTGTLRPFSDGEFKNLDRGKHGFEVLVTTLRNGHPQNRETTSLYFRYTTKYHEFIEELRITTHKSAIPPINVAQLHSYDKNEVADTQSKASGIAFPTLPHSFTAPSGPSSPRFQSQRDVQGYTLADGPWLYRVALNLNVISNCKAGAPPDREIKDADTYREMIDFLKDQGKKKTAEAVITVLVKHSLDEEACRRWRHHLEEEAAEEQRYAQRMKSLGRQHGEESDIGEPYMAAQTRRLAAQRKAGLSKYWDATHGREITSELSRARIEARKAMAEAGLLSRSEIDDAMKGREKVERAAFYAELEKRTKGSRDQDDFQRRLENLWP